MEENKHIQIVTDILALLKELDREIALRIVKECEYYVKNNPIYNKLSKGGT